VAYYNAHTLIMIKDCALWTFGFGRYDALGLNHGNNRLVLMCINAHNFGCASMRTTLAKPTLSPLPLGNLTRQ